MNKNVTQAVARLQTRLAKTTSAYRADVLEEALNRLVSRPHKLGSPQDLIDGAVAFALVKLSRRQKILQRFTAHDGASPSEATGDQLGATCVEAADLVARLPPAKTRILVLAWTNNDDACAVAREMGKSVDHVRQSLSRARASARALRDQAA